MSHPVITVENLGKKYRIRHEDGTAIRSYVALRDVIADKVKGLFKSRKSEITNRKSVDDFWALKEVSFDVDQGEVIQFKGVLDDLPNQPRGIFVTRTGFQSGAIEFAKKEGINYTMLLASPQTADLYGGVLGIPTTFVIDRQGRIVKKFVGVMPRETFEQAIQPLLAS